MRFKNLTIHVTLGFLSVIALVALALLPITNGICEGEFYEGSWIHSNNNTQASYNAKHYGKHWSISAAIDARGVTASVSVSPFELTDWTESGRLEGTATVTAFRDNYRIWDTYIHGYGAYDCGRQIVGFCVGHPIQKTIPGSGVIYTNERRPDAPEGDSLILDIQVTTRTVTKAKAWSKKESKEVTITIGLDLELPESGLFSIGSAGTYKDETLKSTSDSWQVTGIKKANIIDEIGRSAQVTRRPHYSGGRPLARYGTTSASTDFSFEEADSDAFVID